jgi:eukaryotic-like serine/threonine-protein kinase
VRSLAADDARPLSGTDGASYPFWSPDGKHIGFFANGKLRTVNLAGGLPEVIADAPNGRGGSWTDDGSILFTPSGGTTVLKIAATGGAVQPLTTLDPARNEDAHYWPVVVPGGSRFLYFARSSRPENSGIYLARLDGSAPAVRLVASLSSGLMATRPSTGAPYLLWARDGDLLAQPLDIEAGKLTGEATAIAKGVRVEESQRLAFAGASRTGIVAWASASAAEQIFALYNREGRRIRTLDIPPGRNAQPALSPDGRRLLYTRAEKGVGSIHLHDLASGANQRVATPPGYSEFPSWTPDGRAVIANTNVDGRRVVHRMTLDSGAPPTLLVKEGSVIGGLETADGRFLIATIIHAVTGFDVVAVPLTGSGTPVPLAATPASEILTSMSRDGRWLVISDAGGAALEIRRLVTTDGALRLSGRFSLGSGGTSGAVIRGDAGEVFFGTADGSLKSIALKPAGEGLTLGPPKTLFTLPAGDGTFSVNAQGNEFVIAESPSARGQTLRVLTNWEKRLAK